MRGFKSNTNSPACLSVADPIRERERAKTENANSSWMLNQFYWLDMSSDNASRSRMHCVAPFVHLYYCILYSVPVSKCDECWFSTSDSHYLVSSCHYSLLKLLLKNQHWTRNWMMILMMHNTLCIHSFLFNRYCLWEFANMAIIHINMSPLNRSRSPYPKRTNIVQFC